MVARGWGEKSEKGVKRYKLPVIKQISHGGVMYSMVTEVNNTVYLKSLKSSHHKKKKFCNYTGDDVK